MRVLLVNYEHPNCTNNCGGGGRITQLLDETLTQVDHDVQVVTDPNDHHWSLFPAVAYQRIKDAIHDHQPDVIHGHFTLPSSIPLPRLASQHDIPLVVTAMGADIYDPTRFSKVRPVATRINDYIFQRSNAVLTPSLDLCERVRTYHDVSPKVAPYGIRPDRWTWQPKELHSPARILTVARLVKRKNLEMAIQAVEKLRTRGWDATYKIVGTGPERDRLESAYGDQDWLTLAGYQEDLQGEYDSADVFFLPSLHEAFGVVFLESLACGLPIVSTPGGQSDIIEYNVGEIGSFSVDSLAAKLASVLDEYDRYQAATEGYVQQRFSAAQMAAERVDVYQRVTA